MERVLPITVAPEVEAVAVAVPWENQVLVVVVVVA
jgi:hypothetical protein